MDYDIIVIGAGHAGAEAALSGARLNKRTLLITMNLESVGFLACNPSIGGSAKGHIVREIDALGGEMGKVADRSLLQLKLLGLGKGAAAHSLRAQSDKAKYHAEMKKVLEREPNLFLTQGEVVELIAENKKVKGVVTALGEKITAKAVILCSGVYLQSRIIIGEYTENTGPSGFSAAKLLSASLTAHGVKLKRFKTGTPARVNARSVGFTVLEPQYGTKTRGFSFLTEEAANPDRPCYLTHTNEKTHKIIRENLHRAPMYSGVIKGVGPRYCPSIEDKIVRFAGRESHQIFLEPEGADTDEIYVQGLSTSLPFDVQRDIIHSIKGLERAEIMRYAYAIEYDCADASQLFPTLMCKEIKGFFTAGQINGTSGYEEAAAQGLIAGINAARFIEKKPPFILGRDEGYIGVLIDDIINKGTDEPYRMMTSRAEYRLALRQDNADMRLTPRGREIGLVDDTRWARFTAKKESVKKLLAELEKKEGGVKLKDKIKRETPLGELKPFLDGEYSDEVSEVAENIIRYEGYLKKQEAEIAAAKREEERTLPPDLDYNSIKGLCLEARAKLNKVKPFSIAQAARINGVTPADITVLLVYLKMKSNLN